jgi:hypothetical protein
LAEVIRKEEKSIVKESKEKSKEKRIILLTGWFRKPTSSSKIDFKNLVLFLIIIGLMPEVKNFQMFGKPNF